MMAIRTNPRKLDNGDRMLLLSLRSVFVYPNTTTTTSTNIKGQYITGKLRLKIENRMEWYCRLETAKEEEEEEQQQQHTCSR